MPTFSGVSLPSDKWIIYTHAIQHRIEEDANKHWPESKSDRSHQNDLSVTSDWSLQQLNSMAFHGTCSESGEGIVTIGKCSLYIFK